MGNDSLKIYIEALLERTKTTNNINSQIEAIQNNIKKINIDLGIDTKILTDFKKQFEQFNQQMISQAQKTQKVIEESFLPDGTKVKRTYYDGTKKEFNLIVDESKKAAKEISDNFVKANETISKSNDKLAEQMAKGHEKAIIKSRELDKQWQLEQDKSINKTIENTEKEKQAKIQKAQEYDQWWQKSLKDKELSNQKSIESQINKINSQKINLTDGNQIESESRIKRIVSLMDGEIAKLEQIKKENKNLTQEEISNLQKSELAWKNYINSQKSREKTQASYMTPDQISMQQRSMNADVKQLNNRYGRNINSSDLEEVKKQINNLNNIPLDKLDNELKSIKLRLKEIQADASQASKSFSSFMLDAVSKFSMWMGASTVFFQSFNFFKDGIGYVMDLNKVLTEISIVTGKSQGDVDKLAESYQKLAMQLGSTTDVVASGANEFYRQGLNDAQVMERLTATSKFAAISNLDFKKSAELLTATTNSMGISIEKASDVFSYLGDATATGKHMCPAA